MISANTSERILRYEQIKLEIKKLETEAEFIADALLSEIPDDAEIKARQGTLSITARTKWVYSLETQEAEKKLKDKQKQEQQLGIAKEEKGKPYLIYRTNE